MNTVFTLCSNNYLGQAKVLGDSYLKYNPGCDFVIGLVDKIDPLVDYSSFKGIRFIACDDLGYKEFPEMQQRYNITEFNTAVKPYYIEYFFNNGSEKVIYLDPDIAVYNSLNDLFDLLSHNDILLTPHTITSDHTNAMKWQQVFNYVGIYNLGFLGLARSENTYKLARWWQERLEKHCLMIPEKGLFVDQIWANYFPLYFEKAMIVRDPGYNMAHWNFRERVLTKDGNSYKANDSSLKFFHFSNFRPKEPDIISRYSDYTFDELPVIKELYAGYVQSLKDSHYWEYYQLKPLIKFGEKKYTKKEYTGMRIKAHSTRWISNIVNKIFDVKE